MIWQLVWCVVGISVGGLCTYSSLASWKLCDPGVALRHWQHAQQACPPGFMPPASHSHLFVPRESFVYWFYWEVQLWKCALWFIKYPVIDVITAVIEILEPGPGSLEFSGLPPLISKTISNVTAVCFDFFFNRLKSVTVQTRTFSGLFQGLHQWFCTFYPIDYTSLKLQITNNHFANNAAVM